MQILKIAELDESIFHLPYESEFHGGKLIPACGKNVNLRNSVLPECVLTEGTVNCADCLRLGSFGSFFTINAYSHRRISSSHTVAPCYVYLIKSSHDSIYKIGCTNDPHKRLLEIQACSPIALELVHYLYFSNAREVEKSLHETFQEHRSHNEWYKLPQSCVDWFCSWGGKTQPSSNSSK